MPIGHFCRRDTASGCLSCWRPFGENTELAASTCAAVAACLRESNRWSCFECLPIQHSYFEQLHRGRARTPGSPPTTLPAYNVCFSWLPLIRLPHHSPA